MQTKEYATDELITDTNPVYGPSLSSLSSLPSLSFFSCFALADL